MCSACTLWLDSLFTILGVMASWRFIPGRYLPLSRKRQEGDREEANLTVIILRGLIEIAMERAYDAPAEEIEETNG